MKSYKKILAAIMAAAMLCTIAGCEKKEKTDENSAESDTSISETADENTDSTGADDNSGDEVIEAAETVLAADYFDSTPLDDLNAVVMTINGKEVTLDEYRYYFLNLKKSADYGSDDYWNGQSYANENGETISAEQNADEKLEALKEQVLTYIKNNCAVELFAEQNNVELTDEEKEESKNEFLKNKQAYIEENNLDDAGWNDYINSIYCTEDLYIKTMERQSLEYKNIRTLYEDDFRENVLPEYVMAKHILLGTTNPDYETKEIPEGATDEEIEAISAENDKAREDALDKLKKDQKALAEEILTKLKDGEDFDKLIAEYNEDPGEIANEDGSYDGYLFTKGEMVEEFETAAFNLGIDEISDIVETSYGYHILKRVDISDDYLDENMVDIIMTNDEYYQKYAEKAQEILANLDIQYTDLYYKINVMSLR
ncbi:MAG: peptidylprolyl isomerase [Oscillospiraceae bacterium]